MMLVLALSISLAGPWADRDTLMIRDSARSLNTPPWWEADVTSSVESFASRLSAWQWHSVAARYRGLSKSHAVEAFTARRYDVSEWGFAVEESSTLGRGAYVEIRAQLAPGATVVPRSDLSATWHRALGRGWEVIPTARLMSFASAHVPILGLGVGRYTGLWYLSGRFNQARLAGEDGITTSANVRRYAADASPDFVDATIAYGHELVVLNPSTVAIKRTTSAALRGQRMLWTHIGASFAITYEAHALLPDRRGAALVTFIRW
jgi:YaiO family outer membrane protein